MKILIVDDDLLVLKQMSHILKSYDHITTLASDGKQAVDLINDQQFDLIIIDIMMPKVSGVQLFNFLKEFSFVPIIFISSLALDQAKILLESIGVSDDNYMVKPLNFDELNNKINRLAKAKSAL